MEKLKAFLQTKLARKLISGLAFIIAAFLTKKLGIDVGAEDVNLAVELLLSFLFGVGVDQALRAVNVAKAEKAGEAAVAEKPSAGLQGVVKTVPLPLKPTSKQDY